MLSVAQVTKSRLVLATGGCVKQKATPIETFENVRHHIMRYVSRKISGLPQDLKLLESYENIDGSVTTSSLATDAGSIWIVRFSEPDEGTPGRSWVVELSVGMFDSEVLLGCRLYCYSRNYDFDFERSVPRGVRAIVESIGLSEYGVSLKSVAAKIETEADVGFLTKLIKNPARWRNVVVISSDEGNRTLVDADRLAKSMSGVAHVYTITPQASYLLSAVIGRELSVFDRGLRIYRPAFSDFDDKSQHPLVLRRQLVSASDVQHGGYEYWIKELCFQASVERKDLAQRVPSFVDVRLAASMVHLNSLTGAGGAKAEEVISAERRARMAAETQAEQSFSLAVQEEELRAEVELQRDSYRSQLLAAQSRIEALEARLVSAGKLAEIGERPSSYSDIPEWVETNFAGKLILHSRVQRGLKSAVFEDLNIVCDTLSLLANEYRQVCLGQMRKDEFEQILREKHLDMSGSISESRAREYGDEYYVQWGGKKEFLHGHVQKGNSREERYCLRIYFFWSPRDGIVVVGWLPSHLKNRLS
ncbi:hypothetical protein H6M51_10865 [Rhizobium sp. AQ_MP]|uniref:hypothetical protein n=1 Tax=Rhizobium sp. AQ_MP TaxID=2761536 RepID=UPI00163A5B3B|nr:hypothetical protein [Rhizobium sp. AQ_MP]MBC2773368.1 hypothetical protein [Rhizobium sp. AQ_MP]